MKKKESTKYIDAFVLVVPKAKLKEYRKIAREAGKIWMKYGALSYKECIGDDLLPDGENPTYLPFPKMVKLKPNETVWFSYIEYKSKTHRNSVNKKVVKEMEEKGKQGTKMPFDMKKMAWGGFKVGVGFEV